jgi:hypothetical protein
MTEIVVEVEPAGGDVDHGDQAVAVAAGAAAATAAHAAEDAEQASAEAEQAAAVADAALDTAWDARAAVDELRDTVTHGLAELRDMVASIAAPAPAAVVVDELAPEPTEEKPEPEAKEDKPKPKEKTGGGWGNDTWFGGR